MTRHDPPNSMFTNNANIEYGKFRRSFFAPELDDSPEKLT